MSKYGIIDLGSNTIRLVVYDVNSNAGKSLGKGDFKTLVNSKKVAGLSAYIENGRLTKSGVEKATDVLAEHLETARNIGCKQIGIFATAVLRNCSNSKEVRKSIESDLGVKIDLLSGEEEARLGFVGATMNKSVENGVLIDIGGGSTEITYAKKGNIEFSTSLGQGSVSSYAEFVDAIFPHSEECKAIENAFLKRFKKEGSFAGLKAQTIFGIGGSVRAVGKMYGRMLGSDKSAKKLNIEDINAVLDLMESDLSRFSHLAVKAVPDRLHTLIPGCIIVRSIMRKLGANTIEICKYGVREGYLAEHAMM